MNQFQSLETLQKSDPVVKGVNHSLEKFHADAEAMTIITERQEVEAVDFIKPLKEYGKKLDEKRKELTFHARGYIDTINGFFNPRIRDLKKIEDIVKGKLISYRQKVEEAARKAQEKIDEENRKKAEKYNERVEKEMARAEEKGTDARFVPPPNLKNNIELGKTTRGESGGITYKKVKEWRVNNFSIVPDQFKILDEKKINKAIQAGIEIPGIDIFEKTVSSIR